MKDCVPICIYILMAGFIVLVINSKYMMFEASLNFNSKYMMFDDI